MSLCQQPEHILKALARRTQNRLLKNWKRVCPPGNFFLAMIILILNGHAFRPDEKKQQFATVWFNRLIVSEKKKTCRLPGGGWETDCHVSSWTELLSFNSGTMPIWAYFRTPKTDPHSLYDGGSCLNCGWWKLSRATHYKFKHHMWIRWED